MIDWIKSKFRYHRYISVGMTNTFGEKYRCLSCGKRLYLPFDWRFRIDPKKIKGCKAK